VANTTLSGNLFQKFMTRLWMLIRITNIQWFFCSRRLFPLVCVLVEAVKKNLKKHSLDSETSRRPTSCQSSKLPGSHKTTHVLSERTSNRQLPRGRPRRTWLRTTELELQQHNL